MPTAVVGERTCKLQGDFITTPGWIRHDHGYTGAVKVNKPVVWLDGLVIPMLKFLRQILLKTALLQVRL